MSIVSAILEREIELVSRFIVALNDEQKCLSAADADALPALAVQKADLAEQLNALESERMAAIGQAGQPSDQASMQTWLDSHRGDTIASNNWQKLRELAREARNLHELNAQLVESHLKRTTEALAILTQQASQSTIYGASGQTTTATGSRIVDSA